MQTTPAAKRKAFFGFNAIVCGVLLLLLIGLFSVSSAESSGYFTGRVWNDLNNDGLMDDAEPGVEGVTLHLLRSDTGEQLTAVTDNTGTYLFSGLPNDSYTFSVSVPQSMLYARYRKEGGDLRSVFTGEDLNISRSFVVRDTEPQINMNVGLVDSAIIKGMAYLDLNYNGNYDEGEPPYANVTMEVIRNASERSVGKMVTDETGAFFFDTTRSGNYRLRAILPDDGSTFTAVPVNAGFYSNLFAAREGRRENSINSIDVENSMVYEYYVGVALGGRITGTVFLDKNYSGVWESSDSRLSGFTVQLIRADGTIAAETNSSNKGVYTFSEVMPGEYALRFLRRDGYTFTKYRAQEENGNTARLAATDTYGETESFSFSMAETLEGLNAGFLQSATLAGIFFYDANDNGLMDENETGFTDGQVRLVSDDGEIDITQTVNADGSYSFGGVAPTTYTLYYLLPENAEMAAVTGGGNTLRHQGAANAVTGLDIKAKKSYTQPLVGAVKLGTFEGYAFDDLNANGMRDDGEATLAGVTVSLQSNNAPANDATVTTAADGLFSITGLRPDNYTLKLSLPDGMIFAGDIIASSIALGNTDTYAAPVSFTETLLNRADNALGAVAPATLVASVWLDENRNGQLNEGERLLDGLEYALYDEVRRQYTMTAVADEYGTAVMRNVRPSTYTVSFALPDNAVPVNDSGTFVQNGRNMQQTGIAVHAGDTYDTISGGLQCTASIGGTVEVDKTGSTSPVEGAQVLLYQKDSTQLLQSTVTDSLGVYRFDGLWPGNYVIEVVRPNGLVFIRPNDPAFDAEDSIIAQINDEYGTSDPVTLSMAEDQLAHRVMLTIPAKVGNLVWLDTNGNGLIDGDEPTINGVTVSLLENGAAVYTTTSNAWGYYEFADVYPGEYTLEAAAYPELAITAPVPTLRIISSCLVSGDGTLAVSDPFTVGSGSVNFFYHLGYTLKEGEEMPPAITEGPHQVWTQSE